MSNSQQRFEAKFPMPDFAEWDASRNNYTHAHALTMPQQVTVCAAPQSEAA
jgi:hypothetical protein